MSENASKYDSTTPVEGSSELNGKGASYRNAPMISAPGTIKNMRIRGALVPMPKDQ
jgi:hypothetical protein